MTLTVLQGGALEKLRELPDESVHCCVTSPPYWGLRDYGTAQWEGGTADCDHRFRDAARDPTSTLSGTSNKEGFALNNYREHCGKCGAKRIDAQLGLEKTPEEYVGKMVDIFREVRRVLRKDGTLWLNLGDSYAGGGNNSGNTQEISEKQGSNRGNRYEKKPVPLGLKPKDLCGIPWRVAFALQSDGWYLRQDIIWAKPNPMPESVTDRCTKAHEYLFLLTKSARYFYDAEAIKERSIYGGEVKDYTGNQKNNSVDPVMQATRPKGREIIVTDQRNKRSVWTVATAPYPEAHFATYPPDLIKPCIMAGTSAKGCCAKCGAPWERIVESKRLRRDELDRSDERYRPNRYSGAYENINGKGDAGYSETKTLGWQPTCECDGKKELSYFIDGDGLNTEYKIPNPSPPVSCTVLDPFAGSGTTGAVALELGRKAILIELNPKYVELIEQRCNVTMGLQLA